MTICLRRLPETLIPNDVLFPPDATSAAPRGKPRSCSKVSLFLCYYSRCARLKAQIEELNKQPGDSTTHPINDGGTQESTPIDDFCARVNAAQKLYDMV